MTSGISPCGAKKLSRKRPTTSVRKKVVKTPEPFESPKDSHSDVDLRSAEKEGGLERR